MIGHGFKDFQFKFAKSFILEDQPRIKSENFAVTAVSQNKTRPLFQFLNIPALFSARKLSQC